MTHMSRAERIFMAAANSEPSEQQLTKWMEIDAENAKHNSYDHTHPSKTPRTASNRLDGSHAKLRQCAMVTGVCRTWIYRHSEWDIVWQLEQCQQTSV